jgi:hypothetical protein
MTDSQVFISLATRPGDIIHEDFGPAIIVNSAETARQVETVMEQARATVREWIQLGHAKTGMVRVRRGVPLPPSGSLCWRWIDSDGRPSL